MADSAPHQPGDDSRLQMRRWKQLADELNQLNAQLEYLKLMLKLDLKLRGTGD